MICDSFDQVILGLRQRQFDSFYSAISSMTSQKPRALLFWIKALVFIDFFAVSLVVPLLNSYFKDVGVSTRLLGYLSSTYSVSQIIGGLIIGGVIADTFPKRDVLILSFLGSAISYLIIGHTNSVMMLFFSRALVGIVKQTYTIATTMVNEITSENEELRSQEMARLSAISTASFTVGPTAGSILYKISKSAPTTVAAVAFGLNIVICLLTIPRAVSLIEGSAADAATLESNKKKKGKSATAKGENPQSKSLIGRILTPVRVLEEQFYELLVVKNVVPVMIIRLSTLFVEWSMNSRNIVNYNQERFGVETASLGYISTITSVLGMIIQTVLVNPLLKMLGGNRSTIIITLIVLAAASFVESIVPSYTLYFIFSLVPAVATGSLLGASVRNVFSNTVPTQHMGKAVALHNVFSAGIGVIAPIYGSHVFSLLPNDRLYLKGIISCVHIALLAAAVAFVAPAQVGVRDIDHKKDDDDEEPAKDVKGTRAAKAKNGKHADEAPHMDEAADESRPPEKGYSLRQRTKRVAKDDE
jgi:MFS transporter, DHA1 family, multidrug resistance protein